MRSGDSGSSSVVDVKTCGMLVLVYWLCCCMWYEDKSENTSRHASRNEINHDNGHRRRSNEFFGRRIGSSAASLHIPSTSGHKKSLSAHRSHEEIRRKSQHESNETRYHSAPSVIDEVLHRRDWERSTRELYIPLKPVRNSDATDSPEKAPHAEPESSSIECLKSEEQTIKPCKKHHTNIKSSKKKVESDKEKESTSDDKDCDVTEQTFYIGDVDESFDNTEPVNNNIKVEGSPKVCKAKEVKQSLNESIKSKERPKSTLVPLVEHQHTFTFSLDEVIGRLDALDTLDRSGAVHHDIESRISGTRSTYPPPSVEAVGYDGCACYLSGEGRTCAGAEGATGACTGGAGAGAGAWRARHASDGDILAPPCRPESGAFSESDLDLDLEGGEERPPPYDELHQYSSPQKKETAI